jgi:hypothetical protein
MITDHFWQDIEGHSLRSKTRPSLREFHSSSARKLIVHRSAVVKSNIEGTTASPSPDMVHSLGSALSFSANNIRTG